MPSPTRRDLMAKSRGLTIAIDKIEGSERTMSPSGSFGSDYNQLRAAVAVAYPQLAPLLPPPVTLIRDPGFDYTEQRYSEISAFAEQIWQLLNEQPDRT